MDQESDELKIELAKVSTVLPKARVAEEIDNFMEEVEGQLTVDVYQTPTEFVVQSTVAGVDPEELDVATTTESITIRGKRERSEKVQNDDYLYQECYWGKFARTITFPQEVDAEKAVASIKNGVLTVRLPKLNREKTKKLRVKVDE